MRTINCRYLIHREQHNIALDFPNDIPLITALRKRLNLKWSRSNKCWYCSCSKSNLLIIRAVAAQNNYLVNDAGLIASMLQEQAWRTQQQSKQRSPKTPAPNDISPKQLPPAVLSAANAVALRDFKQLLILKAYSPSTIRTYIYELLQFFSILKDRPAAELNQARLKDYLQYCLETLKLSEATVHSRINALKFYYEQVLNKEKFFWEIPRPKKHQQLPKVLSEKEIGRLFNSIGNLKHKAILFTAYSAGLRVSEVVNLKLKDVDSERMQLFVENAKGKKDRYTSLGILLLDVLRAYLKKQNPRPLKYVFENPQQPGEPYSIRAAQSVFQLAKQRAFINKDVGIHSLRHSFATHLLEKGIDIRYIKELLGHFSIKTTERYLHVKREQLICIPNLLDELNKTVDLDW